MSLWDSVRVPWAMLVAAYRVFRRALFTVDRPTGTYYKVLPPADGDTVAFVERVLGVESYAPNWEFSYYERGEHLNLARVVWHTELDNSYRWWQTHVRGWLHDDGSVWLTAHWELEPTENRQAHIDGVGFDADRGMATLRSTLVGADVEYVAVEYPDDA